MAVGLNEPCQSAVPARYRGSVPSRRRTADAVAVPPMEDYARFALEADGKEMSTTMAAVRMLGALLRDKTLGPRIVPIVADEARTNPGSEAMIAILKQAAPCLILLDEVVAYARNLEGIPYDGFVSFLQSLTEAASAVPGVLVVGSLPESGAEVGNQRGREALLALRRCRTRRYPLRAGYRFPRHRSRSGGRSSRSPCRP